MHVAREEPIEVVDMPPEAMPFGVFSRGGPRRLGVAVGTDVVDLEAAAATLRADVDPAPLTTGRLDELLAAGRPAWSTLRAALLHHLPTGRLDRHRIAQHEVILHLPWSVGDYVDFYSSLGHVTNVGRIFRPGRNPVPSNWRHVPVGYHGRSGTVVVDGTPLRRPWGHLRDPDGGVSFAPTARLDFEAELGWVLGGASEPGRPVAIGEVEEHLFGTVLLNDWSARDIQGFESSPLGPFLGKSFATSVSAWVLPVDAMEAARTAGPAQEPTPAAHLQTSEPWAFEVAVEVWLRPAGTDEDRLVAAVDAGRSLYWNVAQQLAHLTSNGTPVRPGDLLGTGTISGEGPDEWGSLLEITRNGNEPLEAAPGVPRTFVEDGDVVTLRASVPGTGARIPLGPVSGEVLPAVVLG